MSFFVASRLALLGVLLALPACRVEVGGRSATRDGPESSASKPAGKLRVYTSLYQHVINDVQALAKKELPEVELEWFASGSEKVAARIEGEMAAGDIRADVLLTSDPFFFARLKKEKRLHAYVPPPSVRVPRELVDPDGQWLTSRVATMVIVYNTKELNLETAPQSYEDFAHERFRGKLLFGDPLASGTFFTTVAFLEHKFGLDYFDRLHANQLISSGGNSAVIERVASGEFSAGLVLLENVLPALKKGAPIAFLLPAEGPIIIPGPVAIFDRSANLPAARAFLDLIFSDAGQALMVKGGMHSPDPRQTSPEGAPAWADVYRRALPWNESLIEDVEARSAEIRREFNRRVQR